MIASYELGDAEPKEDVMERLSDYFKVAVKQLMHEKIIVKYKAVDDEDFVGNVSDRTNGVPVYDIDATAGNMELGNDFPELIKGYINLPSFRDCIAFLNVRGDSMTPKLKAGDIIGVIPVQDMDIIQYGQTYLVVTKDNQRMIKYLRKGKDDSHLILKSENNHYDDINLEKKKIVKLFIVKGPIRDDWQ